MTENDKCALVNNDYDLAAGGPAGSREALVRQSFLFSNGFEERITEYSVRLCSSVEIPYP